MFAPQNPNPPLAATLILLATAFIAATTLLAKALGHRCAWPTVACSSNQPRAFCICFCYARDCSHDLSPPIYPSKLDVASGSNIIRVGRRNADVCLGRVHPARGCNSDNVSKPGLRHGACNSSVGRTCRARKMERRRDRPDRRFDPSATNPDSFQPAALLALGAALLMGMELIFIKKLSGREPIFQILLINNLIGVCIATAAVLPVWIAPTAQQWIALGALGLMMACAQTLFVNAMARADASFVAPFSYATLIMAAIYDFVGFGVIPDVVSVFGAAIIIAGALLLAIREARIRPIKAHDTL